MDEDIALLVESIPQVISDNLGQRLTHNDILSLTEVFCFCETETWDIFAQDHLNLSRAETKNIEEDSKNRTDKIFKMFHRWQEIEETNCTYADMIRIFDEAKLCGIKERWFSLYKDEKQSIEAYFKSSRVKARNEMKKKDWGENENLKSFLRLLQLEESDLSQSKPKKRIEEILDLYENRFGFGNDALSRLFETIDKVPDLSSYRLFYKKRKTESIYRCQGCRDTICPNETHVIAHKQLVIWTEENGKCEGKLGNGYYHYKEQCVKMIYSDFNMEKLRQYSFR